MARMNFNILLKDAIAKGASRVARKPVLALRQDVTALKRQVVELRRLVRELQRAAPKKAAVVAATDEAVSGKRMRRPTASSVKQLRAKLGLTQAELSQLLGVSSLTISKWECASGLLTMRTRTLQALQQARGLGKREARAQLAAG
jgi:DNA-binding transcriptional regulator YiaG